MISFSGIKTGSHNYNFQIGDWFFENFEYSEIKKGNVGVDLVLNKQENMLVLDFAINGNVNVTCDRCLENFDFPVNDKKRLIVKFGDKTYEQTDEITILSLKEYQIDISKYIYEYIHLLLPIKRVHPDEKNCNNEIINILKDINNAKNNNSVWDALKKNKLK